jgi:hypothetical protein
MIQIKDRWTGKVIYKNKNIDTLCGADLRRADLSRANLNYCEMDENVFKQLTEEWFEWKITKKED